jgi:hypothetical protein
VAALVISGVLPALGIGISALADRRLDVIGIVVLAGLLAGTLLGLTSHNARLYLLEGWVPPAVFARGCLLSLRLRCHGCLAVSRLPAGLPDDHRGVGTGYLVEAAIRVAIVVTSSTGIALVCSKLIPTCLPWSCPPGRSSTESTSRGQRKAERLADADASATATATADAGM